MLNMHNDYNINEKLWLKKNVHLMHISTKYVIKNTNSKKEMTIARGLESKSFV